MRPLPLILAGVLAAGVIAVPTPASALSTVYEAESATVFHGTVDADHTGYTGSGFVNSTNEAGAYVEWSVPATSASAVTLVIRYSEGVAAGRPATVALNGTTVATPSFPSTVDWNTWSTQSVPVTLAAGTNRVRVTSTTVDGLANLDSLTVDDGSGPPPGTDWTAEVVRSTMQRYTPATLGSWSYPVVLYLYGQYLYYQRTHDPALLAYIKAWVDRFVGSNGSISVSFNSLDNMLGGRLLLILYTETGQQKYRTAAATIRNRLTTYPRTTDGGFWHSTDRTGQLWDDGAFMAFPFLAEYGAVVGDATATDEAARQIQIYYSHLKATNGLLKHAWDEDGSESWANPSTHQSAESWCRAVGWFGMATAQILDVLPANQPRRSSLVSVLQTLVPAYASYQDPATGRWFQVVDKGTQAGNWTETSCSAMFAYAVDKAVAKGYVGTQYQPVADRGYAGVLQKISLHSDNLTYLTDISIGTSVGDYAYYIGRTRATNDFHGLGAFLIMNEQLR
ncbi:glycoside hydrolase family 88 protein [Hamadaea tsunoensis]|uniref:glycoside hydrolase family 88 protein n=1 Tax=Hamadaea tsunoensis TaxID=53368 RepID=UPI000426ED55|nr:glycoside hydrolase family 88 protein [Hamadaea tsunoensis]